MAIIKWKTKKDMEVEKQKVEITALKKQLEDSDYMIVKSSEYQLLGLEVPYNLEELHTERQLLRDKINELENL
jgi:hypothetical protein